MWPDEQIVFQYFAIDSNENLPENLQIEPKCAKNFDQNQINLKYIAKDV